MQPCRLVKVSPSARKDVRLSMQTLLIFSLIVYFYHVSVVVYTEGFHTESGLFRIDPTRSVGEPTAPHKSTAGASSSCRNIAATTDGVLLLCPYRRLSVARQGFRDWVPLLVPSHWDVAMLYPPELSLTLHTLLRCICKSRVLGSVTSQHHNQK